MTNSLLSQGMHRIVHCRPRPKDQNSRPKAWAWGSGGSKPPPHQSWGLGSAVSSLSRVWGRTPTAQRFFTIFSTQDLRMASPDTIVVLIMDYHAAIGWQDPPYSRPPCICPCTVISSYFKRTGTGNKNIISCHFGERAVHGIACAHFSIS